MKILIVDDDEALGLVFSTTFKKNGFDTVVAANGKTGIDKAKTEKPSLILLDQILPDISGNEILKVLKVDPQTQNIPVIILSNFSQEQLVREAINNGAKDYIFKYQVEPIDVVSKVKSTLKMA